VLNTFYTRSKARDDCETDYGVCTGLAPISKRNLNKGRAGYDRHHSFITSATYEIPVGQGKHFLNRGAILIMLIGGYELACVQTFVTGNPMSVS
jgi:hypothetical protein